MRVDRAEVVRTHLNVHGWMHLSGMDGPNDFESICSDLGTTLAQRVVKIDGTRTERLNNPPAMPLHTDHPHANYVAWYCHNNIPAGGESLICDGINVVASLPAEIRRALRGIRVRFNKIEDGTLHYCPILRELDDRKFLCYAPWLVEEPVDVAGHRVLRAFEAVLSVEQLDHMIVVNLKKGDALLIDNHRFLHGRKTLPSPCQRELSRRWIKASPDLRQVGY